MRKEVGAGLRLACLAVLVAAGGINSGCAMKSLKEANRRLKESNDRLISENNRLEHELAALEGELDLARSGKIDAGLATASANIEPDRNTSIFPIIGEHEIIKDGEGIHVRFPDRVFFSLGQSKLTSQGQAVLDKMARLLNERYPGQLIRVEGHTDDVPVRKVRHLYPSNWELSTARACTVVRYLVEQGRVSPQRIYPAGFAYFRPLATGTSTKARSQNRRVEITILNERASIARND